MQFIEDLKLRSKILFPVLALIAIALASMGALASALSETSASYQALIYGPRLAARVALRQSAEVSELGRIIDVALLHGDSVNTDKLARDLDELKALRKQSRDELERLVPERAETKAIRENAPRINEAVDQTIDKIRQRDPKAAAFWFEHGSPPLAKQRTTLHELETDLTASSNRATEALIQTTKATIARVVGLSLGVTLLVSLFALWLIQTAIVKPIALLTQKTIRLSKGDGDFDLPELDRRDEYGDLARALKVFKDNAARIRAMSAAEAVTQEIGAVIKLAAGKDFTAQVDLSNKEGFLREIGDAVNELIRICRGSFKDFSQKSAQTSVSVDEASTAIGHISDGARSQTEQLSQVSTALTESAKAIKLVTSSASSAREKADAAATAVALGQQAVSQLEPIVEAISQNSRKINQITQVIAQIANRTHILSLNAAIEAARAGEHGRGFVVVAQEVGKLAESSAQNAKQITDIVEQASTDAQQGKVATATVSESMRSIAKGTQDTTERVRSIAVAMDEQEATISQIEGNVARLRNIALTNSASAEQITATMVQLSRLASDTRHQLGAFKTGLARRAMSWVEQLSKLARERIGLKPSLSAPRIEALLRSVPEREHATWCRQVVESPDDGAPFRAFAEALLVHETYFFRHPDQLRMLSDDLLPKLLRERAESGRRELRVWCAGCASGEEAFTAALLVQAAILASPVPSAAAWATSIVATDLSDLALEQARAARYEIGPGLHSFRDVPMNARHHFPSIFGAASSTWSPSAELRAMVSFRRHNLVTEPAPVADADVVLCRNTLIYFEEDESARALASLENAVRPGGVLVLGPAEMPRAGRNLRMLCTAQAVCWTREGA